MVWLPCHCYIDRSSELTDNRLQPVDILTFHAGKPVFGTLIALLVDGVPVLGILDQPITKERWLGVQGRPTTLNGEGSISLILYHEEQSQHVTYVRCAPKSGTD